MVKSLSHLIWFILGLLLMLTAWGIVIWVIWHFWWVIVFLVGAFTVAFVLWALAYILYVGVPR